MTFRPFPFTMEKKKGVFPMRRIYAMAMALVLLFSAAVAANGIGSENDPAVSLSYAKNVWLPALLGETAGQRDRALQESYNRAYAALAEKVADGNLTAQQNYIVPRRGFGRVVLKQGDVLFPQPGCKVTLFSGAISADQTLINVTTGHPAGTALALRHLYMQGENASPGLTVTTPAAEVLVNGTYALTASDAVDYGSLADGLAAMGLFRGMTTGYELLGSTTRAQGLVMFLRLMGKENEALQCRDTVPFTDVPVTHWAHPYVAYAYKNGLTTGVSATAFQPDAPVTAQHYLTFLLRALEYAEGSRFTYNTVLSDVVTLNLFSQEEISVMSSGTFMRYKMVYLSYYALFCPNDESGQMLVESLISTGAVGDTAATQGMAAASGWRLG